MVAWNTYRMWRLVAGQWKATQITFRARSQPEAQRKANKFWVDADLGVGTMVCVLDGTTPEGKANG